MKNAKKILVAMSGGVDSSVATAVLIEEGIDVCTLPWADDNSEN